MPAVKKNDVETISVSSEGRKRARIKTFAAELRDMRMVAAKDALHPTKSVSGQGAMISKSLASGQARDPKEVPKWNPREDGRDDSESSRPIGTATFRSIPRAGLQMIDPRNRPAETPPPGHYEKTVSAMPIKDDKGKKRDHPENSKLKINTAAGRDAMTASGHLYHSMLRGYDPPAPKKRSLQEKEQKRMDHAEKAALEKVLPPETFSFEREQARPTLQSHPYSRIAAKHVGKDEAPDVMYRITKRAYYSTVAKGPIFFNTDQMVGREKDIFPPRDWERGADGQLSCAQRAALEEQHSPTPNIKRSTGRDSQMKLMNTLSTEVVPDTVYKMEEAVMSSKPRAASSAAWTRGQEREHAQCAHRFGVNTHWCTKSSMCYPSAKSMESGRDLTGGDYDPRSQARPGGLPDFRMDGSRTQMFLQSNDESNNTSQINGVGLRQHFSSQRKVRSPRENWGNPPYSVLDTHTASRSHVPNKIRGYETPGITTPIIKLGRSSKDAKLRTLTAGKPGGHTDFRLVEDRKRWRPADGVSPAPPPQTYTPNHNAVKSRVSTVDFHQMSVRNDSWGPFGGASHLEPGSPDHSAVHPCPSSMRMTKGIRNTSMVLKREGCDTSYSPRDVNRNVGNCPVRIGEQAGRNKHSGNRFENQFATPGDFMPTQALANDG